MLEFTAFRLGLYPDRGYDRDRLLPAVRPADDYDQSLFGGKLIPSVADSLR